ncbi:MAG: hypothetical protein HZB53_06325 [Chloroflexi bacterium]|nr:hypothetical protein [Chloroflexota bacterium]
MSEFDKAHRVFVSYIDKSREYYRARGSANPYRWAYHTDTPFVPLAKPLAECRIGLITTAALPGDRRNVRERVKQVYAAPAVVQPALYTEHLFWHKEATHTRDIESYLPIQRLAESAEAGVIGSPSPRFYGVPTDYSQRKTESEYAPAILAHCRADAVDAVLLFPL